MTAIRFLALCTLAFLVGLLVIPAIWGRSLTSVLVAFVFGCLLAAFWVRSTVGGERGE